MFYFNHTSKSFKIHGVDVELNDFGGARIYTKNPNEAKLINKYLHDEGYFDNLSLKVAGNEK